MKKTVVHVGKGRRAVVLPAEEAEAVRAEWVQNAARIAERSEKSAKLVRIKALRRALSDAVIAGDPLDPLQVEEFTQLKRELAGQ